MPGVTPYRMVIQQGNFISQEMVDQLKPGMTRDQVRFALGTPLMTDMFHADRWDYLFVRQRVNSREVERRRISIFFAGDKLARVEGAIAVGVRPATQEISAGGEVAHEG